MDGFDLGYSKTGSHLSPLTSDLSGLWLLFCSVAFLASSVLITLKFNDFFLKFLNIFNKTKLFIKIHPFLSTIRPHGATLVLQMWMFLQHSWNTQAGPAAGWSQTI